MKSLIGIYGAAIAYALFWALAHVGHHVTTLDQALAAIK